jgi:predicted hotdog family 3-hydroxylacyl-ACP dehydratase
VRLAVARLDHVPQPVEVTAERLAGDRRQAQYRFALRDAGGRLLAEGRATVVLDTPLIPPTESPR